MDDTLKLLKASLVKMKSTPFNQNQCLYFQTNIKIHQENLFNNIENIVNDYNRTSKELLECEHLDEFLKGINNNHPCNSTTLKHSILYYGFMINNNNIVKLHFTVNEIMILIANITKLDR